MDQEHDGNAIVVSGNKLWKNRSEFYGSGLDSPRHALAIGSDFKPDLELDEISLQKELKECDDRYVGRIETMRTIDIQKLGMIPI
ncbi:hypothetical protein YC2023_109165 [Brassica napus]